MSVGYFFIKSNMIIIHHRIFKLILKKGYHAMCIWPFIFVRPETNISEGSNIINHERIHARQQLEMLWLFFFVWYGTEFVVRLICCRNHFKAYNAIAFEKEAYENESDYDYLAKRKAYAWFRNLWRRAC